jgi:glutamyl/glutaminyl-tRNA synthetase
VFNFIVIIDDALMRITHVIRGEDHLPNTPKQILVARALGLPVPEYAHLALVLGPDRSKLSKRHGITSVEMYRAQGYLPEALLNFLAMLGWAAESGEEILPVDEIVRQVEIGNLARSAAVFDFQKLRWMNANYIRNYGLQGITDLFSPFLRDAGYAVDRMDRAWLEKVIDLIRGNCEVLSDVRNFAPMFMDDLVEPDEEARTMLMEPDSRAVIEAAHAVAHAGIEDAVFGARLIAGIKEKTSLKGKKLFMPVRAILTGSQHGPELDLSIPLIGPDRCRKRIDHMYTMFVKK